MKIAVMGSGSIGGYLGARMAAAGAEVTFVARGAHLAAIRAHGLTIRSPLGDLLIAPAAATDDPAAVGAVDAVLLATKLYDVEAAARAIGADDRPGHRHRVPAERDRRPGDRGARSRPARTPSAASS